MNVIGMRMNGLRIILLFLLLFLIVLSSFAGILGWQYYRESGVFQSISSIVGNGSNNRSERQFTNDTVLQSSGDVVGLIKKTSPAVVTIISKSQAGSLFSENLEESQGVGTGFFVSDDGLLVTNEHVVCDSQSPENISVVTSDNKTYRIEKVVADPAQDIAVLKVNTEGNKVPFLKFANINSIILAGQEVIAIGNPLGVNPGSVTRGIISGVERNVKAQGSCKNRISTKEYEGVLQTDAAINQGNSGGPLLNMNGEVVGINSATSIEANNISYAIPFNRVVRLLLRYDKSNGKLAFPFIGIQYLMIDPNVAKSRDIPAGALVRQVQKAGPADKAGIKKGDIITRVEDKSIDFSLQSTLNQYFEPGQKVKIEVYRPKTSTIFGEDINFTGEYLAVDLIIGER
jgi:serine protease Do